MSDTYAVTDTSLMLIPVLQNYSTANGVCVRLVDRPEHDLCNLLFVRTAAIYLKYWLLTWEGKRIKHVYTTDSFICAVD